MLQRIFIYFSLILLFAITQMGVATHAISHLAENSEHHQQEQNSHENQCGQCLSLSHLSDADTTHVFEFKFVSNDHLHTASVQTSLSATTPLPYVARSPPYTSQV